MITHFPPLENADEYGLIAVGGDLEVESLKLAYSKGIFPWPINKFMPLAWFSPDPRGVLDFDDLHIPKSLKKVLNKEPFEVRYNTNFEAVILNCARSTNRKNGEDTWITDNIINAYIDFHRQGYAFSVEVYDISEKDRLVGGLYGVIYKNTVSGESMFYVEDYASQIALISLIEKLKSLGINWIDTQMVTPIIKKLGGKEISRKDFISRIDMANEKDDKKIFQKLL